MPTRSSSGRDSGQAPFQAILVDGFFGREVVAQPKKQLTVHLGVVWQAESAEQIISIVDDAVMGADDDAGSDGCCGC